MEKIIKLVENRILEQRKKLLQEAERFVPNITEDDLLQPNDYPELEHNPQFRYEEGILEGMLTLRMMLLLHIQDKNYSH